MPPRLFLQAAPVSRTSLRQFINRPENPAKNLESRIMQAFLRQASQLFALVLIVLIFLPESACALAHGEESADISRYAKKLERIAHPLDTADDLDPLLDAINGRRTVLLGEATHGTREFYSWRAEITRRLIEEKDFSFIAVEGDWNAFMALNRYVKDLPGAPESARDALMNFDRWPRWMWVNAEIAELAEWLRSYNDQREAADKVGFYGMDIYGAQGSLEKGPRYMAKIDEEAAGEMKAAFDCFAPYVDNPRQYVYDVAGGRVNCADDIAAVLDDLRENRDAYEQKDRTAWFHAKQNTAVAFRAEKHYRMMVNRDASSWNARARNFYETVERLADHYGENAGAIAWAHNTHVGDARAMQTGPGMENLGMHARKSLGDDNVFILGFGTHHGEVTAARAWEGERETMTMPEAMAGTLEDVMNRMESPTALFIAKDAEDIAPAWEFIGHRAIGVTYNPENERGNYVPTVWPQRYDAFLFIDETGPLHPLNNGG